MRAVHIRTTGKRWKHLTLLAFQLVRTGQFSLVRAALRRRFWNRVIPLAPIEHIEENQLIGYTKAFGSDVGTLREANHSQDSAPIVSVVIPCFNYGSFVHRAIDSILAQTLSSVEIIVVEGGSTDGETTEIVRNLDRPRTRVIMQDRPTLVGANRNAGITAAAGRYVCCLDADDTLDPTYLEKAVYLLETHRYDVVSTGIRFTGARTGTIDVIENPTLRDMTEGNHVTTCAVFSRHLWKAIGGFTDTGKGADHVAEDWDFWVKAAAAGARIRNITGEYLFNYTIHDKGSLSSSSGVQSKASQGAAIMARNSRLLTSEAFAKSAAESRRRISLTRSGGRLLDITPSGLPGRRLLIVVPYLIVGGAERLLSAVTRLLVAQGWSITVISTLPQEGHDDASSWFKKDITEVYMLPRFLKEWEREGFVEYIIESRRCDALILAGSLLIYNLLPVLNEKYKNLAVIDLLFNIVGHTHSHAQQREHIIMAIAENAEVFEWFKATGRPGNQIRLIESGIDASSYQIKRPLDIAERLDIADDEIIIGFSGRLSSEKAPEVFVEMAEALGGEQNLSFVMTGNGPMRSAVEAKVRALPSNIRFKFMGMVDDPIPYFALYDIFVLPSRLDGRPLALLEAMSSGCAIVASNIGGVPAIIAGSGAGILCAPGQVDEFVDAIRELISDPKKLFSMKQLAAEFARTTLSETRMADAYAEAIEAAILTKRQITKNPLAESEAILSAPNLSAEKSAHA
jgi:glycosyltransferase involved in cell wall biosynthesis